MAILDVNMYKKESASVPDILYSAGGTCIIVGIYDPLVMKGYMGHHPRFVDAEWLETWLQSIIDSVAQPDRLKAYAGGGMIDCEESANDYSTLITMQSRQFVTRLLRNLFKNVNIEWAPRGMGFEINLDTVSGAFTREHVRLNSLERRV